MLGRLCKGERSGRASEASGHGGGQAELCHQGRYHNPGGQQLVWWKVTRPRVRRRVDVSFSVYGLMYEDSISSTKLFNG